MEAGVVFWSPIIAFQKEIIFIFWYTCSKIDGKSEYTFILSTIGHTVVYTCIHVYLHHHMSAQSGKTALQLAATKSYAKVVETLLGAHADVNLQEKVLGLIHIDVQVHVHSCILYRCAFHSVHYSMFHNQRKRISYCL